MNNTGYNGVPGEDSTWINQDHLLLGVGVGAGLLFSMALLAIIATLACRGQHIRRGRRSRRLTSTVSMAYSDFETYKVARPQSSSPSTNLSTISSSSLSQIYPSPFKTQTMDKGVPNVPTKRDIFDTSGQTNQQVTTPDYTATATIVSGAWRNVQPTANPVVNTSQLDDRRQKKPTEPGRRQSDITPVGHPNLQPAFHFGTKILSPDYQGKKQREDHTRPIHHLSTA